MRQPLKHSFVDESNKMFSGPRLGPPGNHDLCPPSVRLLPYHWLSTVRPLITVRGYDLRGGSSPRLSEAPTRSPSHWH
eukprot:488038-Hanusia_phi.AAC.1